MFEVSSHEQEAELEMKELGFELAAIKMLALLEVV